MADTKVTDLATITRANLASGDKIPLVDISDTSMAASGTDKSVTFGELTNGLLLPFGNTAGGSDFRGLPGWVPVGGSGNLAALSQYDIYTIPIFVPSPITLTGWDIYISSGNAASTVFRVAVFASSGSTDVWQVGALVSDTGTVATTATGAVAKTGLSVSLAAGWHVIAFGGNASALVLYGPEMALCSATRIDLSLGNGLFQCQMRWWYDYTSSPDYPGTGFPTPLTGNSQTGLQITGANAKLPINLRWTNP